MLLAPLGFMMLFPHVYRTLRYEPRDFTPVSTVASTPTLLTVGPRVPGDVSTLADFVAWCRANPRQATYGTAGAGTTLHFLGAMLGRTAGFEFLSRALSRQWLDPGFAQRRDRIQPLCQSAAPWALVRSGDLRALATTGPHRSPLLPAVPTVGEAGYPSLEDLTWYGICSFQRRRQRILSKSSMLPSKRPCLPTR